MKRIGKGIMLGMLFIFIGLAIFTASVGCLFSAPRYTGPKSDHFDGDRFYNQDRTREKGFSDFFKWVTNRDQGAWDKKHEVQPGQPPPNKVSPGELRVTFINHSTVLIQMEGLNILTDPIWSERASPMTFAGPKRVGPPGIRFDDLPPIDAVLVSHNHYDHLDVPTLRRLSDEHGSKIFSGLGNAKLLQNKEIKNVYDLDWWQSIRLSESVRVIFVPAQHFSSRGLFDHHKTLWGGFVIESPLQRVYFAGDTGFGDHFEQIRERFDPITLALLPIGAYKPRWFMSVAHLSPQEAVKAHGILRARHSMAIHFGTFPLGDDGEHEPVEELQRVLDEKGLGNDEFWIPGLGEGRMFRHAIERAEDVFGRDRHTGA
jgi:L-ascorbate metabolism protein UlaG (beta-lactamase superfamily)